MLKSKLTIREYLGLQGRFMIPAYQRGYKWGVSHSDGITDAQQLVIDLVEAYRSSNGKKDYFIQGLTVYETIDGYVLIDGQQRTTTLFLLLSLVIEDETKRRKLLFVGQDLKLNYDIRTSSHETLSDFCGKGKRPDDSTQDNYYFSRAIISMEKELENIDKQSFADYILDKVCFFFILVDKDEASNVFAMMNGNKAVMSCDELIKADFLCKSSVQTQSTPITSEMETIDEVLSTLRELIKQETSVEWEVNAIRSRLAREWDKWLYWWNRADIRRFFKSGKNPMGLLLYYYCHIYAKDGFEYSYSEEEVTTVFKHFQNAFLIQDQNGSDNTVKMNFEKLRKLQKRFEDLYNDVTTYNYLGLLIQVSEKKDLPKIIRFFIENRDKKILYQYLLFRLIGATELEIDAYFNNDPKSVDDPINAKAKACYEAIASQTLYEDKGFDFPYKYLFFKNMMASNERGQKFEFFYKHEDSSIRALWDYKSYEHIWPKSKVEENASEESGILNTNWQHSIGNLVFLHSRDNSLFKDKTPEQKKDVYFNLKEMIYSRGLLHTMAAFGGKHWGIEKAEEIIKHNYNEVLTEIKNLYGIEQEHSS